MCVYIYIYTRRHVRRKYVGFSFYPQLPFVGASAIFASTKSVAAFDDLKLSVVGFFQCKLHGLVNIQIKHHPTIEDTISNKYIKLMYKRDIKTPVNSVLKIQGQINTSILQKVPTIHIYIIYVQLFVSFPIFSWHTIDFKYSFESNGFLPSHRSTYVRGYHLCRIMSPFTLIVTLPSTKTFNNTTKYSIPSVLEMLSYIH